MNVTSEWEKPLSSVTLHGIEHADPPRFLDSFRTLLENWAEAKKAEQAAQTMGGYDEVAKAGWGVTDQFARLQEFKEDSAMQLVWCFRWLQELYPNAGGPIRDLIERITALEKKVDELSTVEKQHAGRITDLEAAFAEEVTR
jgi:hypothetical protein